jgi:archaellum biogenesis protein FlaJ (TadC family)
MGSSLMTVSVFAAAISFGALLTIPTDAKNGARVSTLLAIASNLFTISVFVSMGIPYILRKDPRHHPLPHSKSILCQIHVWTVVGSLVAGFIMMNVVLINFDQERVGYAGIGLLSFIPFWYIGLTFMERRGALDHNSPEDVSSEQADRPAHYPQGSKGNRSSRQETNRDWS